MLQRWHDPFTGSDTQKEEADGWQSGFFGAEFQGGFPACGLLTGQFAATGDAGKASAELSFTEDLERSTRIKRHAGPEVREDLFVGTNPFHQGVALFLPPCHLCPHWIKRLRCQLTGTPLDFRPVRGQVKDLSNVQARKVCGRNGYTLSA